MHLLILGPSGQVGGMLTEVFKLQPIKEISRITTVGRTDADRALPAIEARPLDELLDRLNPNIIVNAIAYTAVDKAESDVQTAQALNARLPKCLADWCQKNDALLIHYSTDFVFDGTKDSSWIESDSVAPLSVYGETKLAGEEALQQSSASSVTLRTSWVYGETGNNFMKTMVRLAADREVLGVVADQQGSPTYSRDIAEATHRLISEYIKDPELFNAKQQLFHLSGKGKTTWHGFAKEIFAQASNFETLKINTLNAISTSDYPTPAIRPANSVMNCQAIEDKYGIVMPVWTDSLQQALSRHYM